MKSYALLLVWFLACGLAVSLGCSAKDEAPAGPALEEAEDPEAITEAQRRAAHLAAEGVGGSEPDEEELTAASQEPDVMVPAITPEVGAEGGEDDEDGKGEEIYIADDPEGGGAGN